MTDFKEGDEVQFLIEEHGWSPCVIFLGNLSIRKEKVINIYGKHIAVTNIEGIMLPEYTLFKSKEDVIDALIKRLEAMKNE